MPWVICLAPTDAASLAPLRLTRGIEVAEKAPFIWLRGNVGDEHLEPLLRGLPAIVRYELFPNNRLRRLEHRIPSETLPALPWQPLSTWLRVQMPPSSGLPERADAPPQPIALRLIRSTEECIPELLVTNLSEWQVFAQSAPEIRLRHLRFAMDAAANIVVRGCPLPPLPGLQFVLHGNIAVKAGFTWEPTVGPEVLARRLGLSPEALAFLHEDGTFTRIEGEQFVPASRNAAHQTAEDCSHREL
jgi:hypothetical protein